MWKFSERTPKGAGMPASRAFCGAVGVDSLRSLDTIPFLFRAGGKV